MTNDHDNQAAGFEGAILLVRVVLSNDEDTFQNELYGLRGDPQRACNVMWALAGTAAGLLEA